MAVASLAVILAVVDPFAQAIVVAVLGGSGVAAVTSFLRAPRQNKFDLVQMQHVIYQELREELDTCQTRLDECEADRERLRGQLNADRGEIDFLRERIDYVEQAMRERHEALVKDAGVLKRDKPPESG